MASVRLTLVRPFPGEQDHVVSLFEELDNHLGAAPGLLLSMVVKDTPLRGVAGRVSVWQSAADANREAITERVLAVRARIQSLSESVLVDGLLEAASGWTAGVPIGDAA